MAAPQYVTHNTCSQSPSSKGLDEGPRCSSPPHPLSQKPQLRPNEEQWHPLFPLNDADFTLQSLEGTLYGVYTYTLRKTCGFFATMFTLPPCPDSDSDFKSKSNSDLFQEEKNRTNKSQNQVLNVYESDIILPLLLSLLLGLPIPPWDSLDQAEQVLNVAEKWDAPGVIALIRQTLFVPRFRDTEPLKLYAIARHFEWTDEARTMPFYTLTLDLYDPVHENVLERIASKYLLPLFELHRKRKEMFREMLDSPERFTAGNSDPYHCSRCGVTELENHTWRAYKQVLLSEMERRPLGDKIGLLSGGLSDCSEALACWEARCSKEGCGGLNYDRYATLRQIRNCLEILPVSI